MGTSRFYFASPESIGRYINRWDILVLLLILIVLFALAWGGKQMATPYQIGEQIPISLDPSNLPFYSLRSVMRLFIALIFSLFFTFLLGTMAAKNRRAEKIIIPAIDVLQSIPVLSFLSITVTGFIQLFPNSLLGPECASIFAVFTAQVWNMVFGFYQSLKTLPGDLMEVSAVFRLSAWQRFWKVEVPFSMSGLLWNMMVSMSASWFFLVLSEAISVSNQNIRLPGIGSYIALAIEQKNLTAIGYAIATMIIVIFLYDQILFRPLVAWSEKFKTDVSPDESEYQSWLIDLIRRSRFMKKCTQGMAIFTNAFINAPWLRIAKHKPLKEVDLHKRQLHDRFWGFILTLGLIFCAWVLLKFILHELKASDIVQVFLLGAVTATRVIILVLVSSLIWIPIGVWIGLRPHLAQRIQPIVQFAAAFPANLFYPLFVIAIVKFHLNVNIWLSPLMILGAQWYILFNIIAGASNIPRELYLAADNFGVKGWLWWKRLALPGIFPFFITGAITAAGGTWNASIVAEMVSWGSTTLKATGLGEYIQASTTAGDFPAIALGTGMMCLYVLTFNHLIWRPLYRMAEARFNFN